MNEPIAASSSVGGLALSRQRYTLRSKGLHWSGFPGALLHSGLGMMLARVSPAVFEVLIGGEDARAGEASRPRPWWMLPPLDVRMAFAPGDDLQLDLFFANPQGDWADVCAQALEALGEAGVGKSRGRFALLRHEPVPWACNEGQGERAPLPAAPIELGRMLASARFMEEGARHIGVQLLTPLRLKGEQGLVQQAPAAALFVRRLLARAAMLSGVRMVDLPLAQQALEQAHTLLITQQDLHWDDLSRYSARQQAELPLGGLTGWLRYSGAGPLDAALAWFAVGEWLHLGTKTTFGLGAYRLLPQRVCG
ncbi:MAG: CRISPR system precrRNA processing endoribonuclease RAMP protein Cas6 [Thiomonas sp.]|uniref:CRISPR system precrRNA processing endoribonuclease RAMP protein Cas6 n=1 Tax=Thiomonas sp. TaxID=2047785 RepID=UPI002A360C1F|nr:CRISPR system precrRNA processing endoribonuclease RAMP protein Cas6 [Thiomonas sp.]MDY0331719.1 CRISPR system precrRNA processing endoribonuclease RAMP protein Cas6 [Thiomonas sp.]